MSENLYFRIRQISATAILTLCFLMFSSALVSAQNSGKNREQPSVSSEAKTKAESLIEDAEVAIKIVAVKDNAASSNEYVTPDEGGKYVSVQIVIENKGEAEWEVKPYNFKLKDAEGNVYETEGSVLSSQQITQPTLKTGVVDGGDFVKGWITFQVGSGVSVKSTKLRYEDSGITVESTIKSGWIALSAILK